MKKKLFAILVSGLWIAVSEFLRNEVFLKSLWVSHYDFLSLEFKTTPSNGMLWAVWSFLLASLLFSLLEDINFKKALTVSWIFSFVMMWIVVFNLQVLPLSLLLIAVPLSALEIWVAGMIMLRLSAVDLKDKSR